jgi:predicted flap endonuclease-1-like 5' DNA nuclease
MSGIVVFTVAFMVILGVTIAVPALPPAETLYTLTGMQPATTYIAGIEMRIILNGLINGLIWGALILAVYAVARRASRNDPLPPMPVPSRLPTPVPERTVRKTPMTNLSTRIRESRTHGRLDKDVETIEGIGHTYGTRLRIAGVKTVGDLLRAGSTRARRHHLANKVDVAPATLLKWVSRADFLRIKGIGTQYSGLLESAGVDTVADLSMRDAETLYMKLRRINMEKNMVRRTPTVKMVRSWVRSAKNLRSVVAYDI